MTAKEKPKEQAAILLKASLYDLLMKRQSLANQDKILLQAIQNQANELKNMEASDHGTATKGNTE